MKVFMRFTLLPALLAALLALPTLATAASIDGASFEAGSGSKVDMVRFGVQSNWERRWFQSNGTHLAAYWDATLQQWRGTQYRGNPGQRQHITSIGITPVFRLRADDGKGWYVEGGIGAHLMSEVYNNASNELSTAFQFGDHIGAGYVFNNGWEAALKLQHFSNGGIKRPNDGVNFVVLKVARSF